MKYTLACAAALLMTAGVHASDPVRGVSGDYVEVRTAEVFTGPCMLGSEADSLGREAIMAWRVTRGSFNGVSLDSLSVVAVVAGDRNLGMHELGAQAPTVVKSVVMVDERGTPAQRAALAAMARALSPNLVRDVVELKSVPIVFDRRADDLRVAAGEASLDVTTKFEHSPVCGAMQWFNPLAPTSTSELGFARTHAWSGAGLDVQWKQVDRKSSFVGRFALPR